MKIFPHQKNLNRERVILSSITVVAVFILACVQVMGYIIPGLKELWKIVVDPTTATINHANLIWIPVVIHTLLATMICSTVNIFKPLKDLWRDGLIEISGRVIIFSLVVGLVSGVFMALGTYLVGVFFQSLSLSLISSLMVALPVSLIGFHSVFFIMSLEAGLRLEFRK